MSFILTIIKWVIIVIIFLIITIGLFVTFAPQFGAKPTGNYLEKTSKSNNYRDGRFYNLVPTIMGMKKPENFAPDEDETSTLDWFLTKAGQIPNNPIKDIPVINHKKQALIDYKGKTRLIWLGHSSFLAQLNTPSGIKNILLDPIFSNYPSPIPYIIESRFNKNLSIKLEDLPPIDTVLISHDHYDHLDYSTIKFLKNKVNNFIVPLGVASHLNHWKVDANKITELDWWEYIAIEGIRFTATPARHFSGRHLTNKYNTLWASWVIENTNSDNQTEKLYFSGDSGYSSHFKDINERFGAFDIAMIENGQYNTKWPDIHMQPEQSVQAAIDLNAKIMLPIHWGAFKLSFHNWNEPVIRSTKIAKEKGVNISVPKIGQPVLIDGEVFTDKWWEKSQ